MLVLTRCPREAVRIGDDIIIRVLRVHEHRVSLGVQAPSDLSVFREEIWLERNESPEAAEQAHALRVLVVEDDPVHQQLIQRSLSQEQGFETRLLTTGEEALSFMDQVNGSGKPDVDLVLLDLRLPKCSGLDVLRSMRSRPSWRTTPVVMLSSADSDQEVSECIEAGANAFVSKASSYREFRQSIHRIAAFWGHARQAV